MAKKYNKRYKYSSKGRYSDSKYPYKDDKWNHKNYHKTRNYYIDKNGEYKEKPWYANFFKVGFSDDTPTRADYWREMDGYKDFRNVLGQTGDSDKWTEFEANDSLSGLERFQLSLNRLWNGSPREWLKLLIRIVILLLYFGLFALLVKSCGG